MKKLLLVAAALIAAFLLSLNTSRPQTAASDVEFMPCNITLPPKGTLQVHERKPTVVLWRENPRFCYVNARRDLFQGVRVDTRTIELDSYLSFASIHSLELVNRFGKTRQAFNPVDRRDWTDSSDKERYERDIDQLAIAILDLAKPGDILRRCQGGSGSCCICVAGDTIVSVNGQIVRLDQEILEDEPPVLWE